MSESSRRERPRVMVEAFCSEYSGKLARHALIVDMSEDGLRLQRPIPDQFGSRSLQLEFEIPGVDEIVWARGQICFDQLWRVRSPGPIGGLSGLLRTSGVRIVAAAARHRRLLREFVFDTWRRETYEPLSRAACYLRG